VMQLPDRFSILAKGVFISYSPLKLLRTPRLAWGFRHTKKALSVIWRLMPFFSGQLPGF